MNNTASHKEISRLVTDMSLMTGSGRPSRNSQGICNTPLQPAMSTTPLPETPVNSATVPHTPVTTPVARSIPSKSNSSAVMNTSSPNTPVPISMQDRQVEVLMPCMRQHNRFVDPKSKPLQPGTVIFCKDLLFIVSANGKICNYTEGNMKQLYVAEPSEHKFLVNEANRPGTLSNILGSVLGMLPGFAKNKIMQSQNTKEIEEQAQATPEASTIDTDSTLDNLNSGKALKAGNNKDNVNKSNVFLGYVLHSKDNTSDIVDFHANVSAQNDTHSSDHTEIMLQTHHAHNEMLNHYNHILIGCFKDIFQTVDTNNLPAVLQTLKELNFILANRVPELSAHYGFTLEPHQVSTEEVPDFISAYLHRPAANSAEHSSRGRPRTRGDHHYRPLRQSSPVPRCNRETNRSDAYPHSHRARSSYQFRYGDRNRHHLYSSPNNQYLHNQASTSYHNNNNIPHKCR